MLNSGAKWLSLCLGGGCCIGSDVVSMSVLDSDICLELSL